MPTFLLNDVESYNFQCFQGMLMMKDKPYCHFDLKGQYSNTKR